jgi:hypothetical protein
MNIFMFYYFFYLFISSFRKPASTRLRGRGSGETPGTIIGVLIEKVGGESGEGGKGLAGMRVGSCFAGFRMSCKVEWTVENHGGSL